MILAFDTFYTEDQARTFCVQFLNWTDDHASDTFEETLHGIEEYKSGEFYKRELPCILSLLKQINLETCKAIIIDGFVNLNDQNKYGLGAYLYDALDQKIPVIGVAKNDFRDIDKTRIEILKGESKKPLYITCKGMDLNKAAECIQKMHGDFRIPTILKLVDSLGRS